MIKLRKPALNKKQIYIVITAAILAFLIISYVVISAIISGLDDGDGSGSGDGPELMAGESSYLGTPLAYPRFESSDVQSMAIVCDNGSYTIKKPSDEEKAIFNTDSDYIFYYMDENGDPQAYAPPICSAEVNFDYTSLYATEPPYNIYKLTYLFVAVGTLYFSERIELSSDTAEREAQLNRYGLSQQERESFEVTYLDDDGKEVSHIIRVGDGLITGTGYYFMVDGRDYVYTSINNNFDYALDGFLSFLHTRLVAAGLAGDSIYEPYLTTDFKQWKNTLYETEGDVVAPLSKVVASGRVYSNKPGNQKNNAYSYSSIRDISVSLGDISGIYGDYSRIENALVGSSVGELVSNVTAIVNSNNATLYSDGAGVYKYTIHEIEALLTSNGEITAEGTEIEEDSVIKVKYSYQIDGVSQNVEDGELVYSHAVIDLGASRAISSEDKVKIAALSVGELSEPLDIEVRYTEQNAEALNYKLIIEEIILICRFDGDGRVEYLDKITEDCVVTYRYRSLFDGSYVFEEGSRTVDLSKITEGDDVAVKNALIGKSVGALGIDGKGMTVLNEDLYLQDLASFITYEISRIKYFVTSEIIVSFEFVNESERDPFHGGSVYLNTLQNKYKNYALNLTACEQVLKLFGGIKPDSSSQSSLGLSGVETVAVGLSPYNMKEYGLYANTVYFELPRGVQILENSSNDESLGYDEITDYRNLDTLGFNLYISDVQADGSRYIGSDMYDVVVKVDATGLEFLDFSFVSFWARRNLALIDYQDLNNVSLEFFMSDLTGGYNFDIDHRTVWIDGNGFYYERPETGAATPYDSIIVNVSSLTDSTPATKAAELLAASGQDSIRLCTVYDNGQIQQDTLGTAYFKEMLRILYSTYYAGVLTEAEQTEILANAPMVMRLSFTVDGQQSRPYVYEFYRFDSNRVLVSVYKINGSGEEVAGTRTSDLYISNFAFKKLVRNFTNLLNGEHIDPDVGYE